jgi:hypothetical protein
LIDIKKNNFWYFKDGKYMDLKQNLEKGNDYYFCVHTFYIGDEFSLKFPSKLPKNPK